MFGQTLPFIIIISVITLEDHNCLDRQNILLEMKKKCNHDKKIVCLFFQSSKASSRVFCLLVVVQVKSKWQLFCSRHCRDQHL